MKIPIAKPIITKEEKKAIIEVLDSGMLAQGKKTKELEEKFAKLCNTKYAIAVNSGTAAIHSSLYASGIKKGDEVITVPFTFVATVNPIIMQGATPIFADVKEDTFNIDPKKIEEKITDKTKAIIAVDLYGQIFDYKSIREIAEDHNLILIEDACQAVNASLDGKKAGTFGKIAAFSFYATKNIVTGEGGMITTNNKEFAELAKRFRNHGQSEQTKYEYHDLGYNYRMADLLAAIGLAQMEKVEYITNKRIKNAELLSKGLSKYEDITIPKVKDNAKHVFHQYTIKVDPKIRDRLVNRLKNKGIGCNIYYPKPLHLYPFFTKMGYREGQFPISEMLSKSVLSLPVHPAVTKEDIDYIIKSIGELL